MESKHPSSYCGKHEDTRRAGGGKGSEGVIAFRRFLKDSSPLENALGSNNDRDNEKEPANCQKYGQLRSNGGCADAKPPLTLNA